MSTSVIPFESGKLPAYLKQSNAAAVNQDLTSHAGVGFPVISIKGKVFAVTRDGERTIIPNPKDPEAAAHSIDMVLVKANKYNSKIFYAKAYQEGDDSKPDCYSNDSITPAPDAQSPQAPKCAACKHNQWGSRIGDNGKKGKSCQDSARLAVATQNQINEPYLLRVPPASLRALADYGTMLAKRGASYQMVLTRISFDKEAATPKLEFNAIGFLPEETYHEVVEQSQTDLVQMIIGTVVSFEAPAPQLAPPAVTKDKTVTDDEVATAVAMATVGKASSNSKAKPADPDVEIDLEDVNFDD